MTDYWKDLLTVFVAMRGPLAVVLIILVLAVITDVLYRKEQDDHKNSTL